MRKLSVLAVVCLWFMTAPTAYAAWWNPIDWVKAGTSAAVETVTSGGGTVLTFGSSVIVGIDKVFHWTWDNLHNKLVHPTVKIITLGTVDFDA